MKFKSHYNSKEFKRDDEVNNQPSKTVPDQAMSVREIMDRYAKGLPIEEGRVPLYEEDDDPEIDSMPDMRTLDISEQREYLEEVKKQNKELQLKYQREQQRKRNPPKPKRDDHAGNSPTPKAGEGGEAPPAKPAGGGSN